jgi:putative lipoprotein
VLAEPVTVRPGPPGTGWVLLDDGTASTRLVDCTDETGPDVLTVTGTVQTVDGTPLAPSDVVTLRLADIALADAPARVLAEQDVQATASPVAYALTADRASIGTRASLAVSVRVEGPDGELHWVTDTVHPVAQDRGDLVALPVQVVPVPRSGH